MKTTWKIAVILPVAATLGCFSCKSSTSSDAPVESSAATAEKSAPKKDRVLTLGAYTTPREVYGKKIIPEFKAYWKKKTGESIEIRESYLGSGAQSRAIVGGFEADIAALSLEPDIERLVKAGLVDASWKGGPTQGMVTRSVVVFGVRKGNPLGVATWDDLAKPDRKVLTPNVKTSGGAMWNIAAMFGAAFRGHTAVPANDEAASKSLIAKVLANVEIMDKGARESMLTFENGVGDIIITYENEMRVAAKMGKDNGYVVPPSTILIENPIAVVSKYAKAHGTEDVAAAFVEFVLRPEIQRYFAEYGLRPVDESAAKELLADFPALKDVFTVRDFGDWAELTPRLFAPGGLYDQAAQEAQEAGASK